jgi:hypothetical protein
MLPHRVAAATQNIGVAEAALNAEKEIDANQPSEGGPVIIKRQRMARDQGGEEEQIRSVVPMD